MTEDFEFLNSDIWIKYTQERYVPIEDIRFRLESLKKNRAKWDETKKKIQAYRKLNSVPLFLETLQKKFWYFPADCIQQKIHKIEQLGNKIFEKIENHGQLKNEFLGNAAIEEAITSAIYEGAHSTRAKAKELIASGKSAKTKDEWMLLNNYEVMRWIKENSQREVTPNLILSIHKIVTRNTLEGDDLNFQGTFRNDTVFVGNHEGVAYEKIEESLEESIKVSIENKRYLHGLVRGIFLHYFTAYIHPFFDGNGRTARTLFYFKCLKNHLKYVELLSISAHLKRGKGNKYERSFELVKENDLDLTYFVDYCLDSLIQAIQRVDEKVQYLLNIGLLGKNFDLNHNQIALLQRLALNKFLGVTAQTHALRIQKTREMARRELKDLYEKKFLREEKEGKKIKYFVDSKFLKENVLKVSNS